MSASAAIKEAADHGIKLWLDGQRLKYAAKSNTPKYLLEKLRIHKAEIVAVLQQEAPPNPETLARLATLAGEDREKADALPNLEEAQVWLEERARIAACKVPERYLDAWAQFQSKCPGGVSEERWRQAVDDASQFLNAFGSLLITFEWKPEELFSAPSPDGQAGVVWWLAGREASSVGHDNIQCSGPVFDRTTRKDWVGYQAPPIRPPRPVWPDMGLPNRILTNLNGGPRR